MTVWQIAAGAKQRDYHDLFLKYGLAFVGGHDNEQHLNSFQLGDIVALKRGISEIVAVGKVVSRNGKIGGQGDKDWLRHFDGWSLESYIFVDWRQVLDPIYPKGLTRGTILRVNHEELKQRIINGFESGVPIPIEDGEPVLTKQVKDEEILTELIRCGLSPIQAENLTNAFLFEFDDLQIIIVRIVDGRM